MLDGVNSTRLFNLSEPQVSIYHLPELKGLLFDAIKICPVQCLVHHEHSDKSQQLTLLNVKQPYCLHEFSLATL